jgi:hypothetical protein
MCDDVILSEVKRSLFDSLGSLRVNSTKSKNPVESRERHPTERLAFAGHGEHFAVAE